MKNTRALALFLMAIVSTAAPTVYQLGIQPRVDGASCSISVQFLELDEELTQQYVAVFNAYLTIENPSDIDVTFSRLNLDVYHHSQLVGRPRLIGTLNTTTEYIIPAKSAIYTRRGEQGLETFNPRNPKQQVVAKLAFKEDEARGSATSEAIGELIQKGFISVDLRGKALVGPFEFDYKKSETFKINFWDPNFVVLDIFNYYSDPNPDKKPIFINNASSPSYTTDYAIVVIRALMHNPSGVPITLNNYTFDLYTRAGESIGARKVASGISIDELANRGYDVDYLDKNKRRTIKDTFLNGSVQIPLNKNPNIWSEVFLAFNFTDPLYWNAPNHPNATTRKNLHWFLNRLFNDPVIDNIYFRGETSLTIGWNTQTTTGGASYKGIKVEIGDLRGGPERPPFIIPNVQLHQMGYSEYDPTTSPKALKEFLSVGNLEVSNLTINREQSTIAAEINASLKFVNPYRLDFNVTNLTTDYFRTNLDGTYNEDQIIPFANGTVGATSSLIINRTVAINATAKPGDPDYMKFESRLTYVPHKIYLTYNTTDYMASGIATLFKDLGLDPLKLNLTNIFWLLGPEGLGKNYTYDPLDIIEYLIKKGIDPIQILKTVNTTKLYNYGDYAWYPLKASNFGTNFNPSHTNRFSPNKDIYVLPSSVQTGGVLYRPAAFLNTRWDVDYNTGFYETNEFDVVRRQQQEPYPWVWEPSVYGGPAGDPHYIYFNGLITDNLPESYGLSQLPLNWLPPVNMVNWRIYTEYEQQPKPYWGFNYDISGGKRGWYLVHPKIDKDIMLKQNITIDVNRIKSPEDIESAWLSVSYQLPSDNVQISHVNQLKLGIGYWNDSLKKYVYEAYKPSALNDDTRVIRPSDLIEADKNRLFANFPDFGYYADDPQFEYSNSREWKVFRVNVTRYLRDAYRRYLTTGNASQLRMEIAVSVRTGGADVRTINIDDVVLQVNHIQRISGQFRFSDLMNYLERNAGPAEGSFFNFLNKLEFNATELVGFAESTLGIRPAGSYSPSHLIRYFTSSDFSLTRMMSILNDLEKAKQTNSPQNFNFLSLMNNTRYAIGNEGENTINTQYGPRKLINTDQSWTVEDPYYMSKEILDTLKYRMFYNENGYPITLDPKFPQTGKELWIMLENFGVTLPWLVVYLRNRGWSEDDIFDAFEAIGLFSETKVNVPTTVLERSYGVLKYNARVYARARVIGIPVQTIDNGNESFWVLLGRGIQPAFEYLYSYLAAASSSMPDYLSGLSGASTSGWYPATWQMSTQPILDQRGLIPEGRRTVFSLSSGGGIDHNVQITPHAYRLAYWMYGLTGSPISKVNTNPYTNPYIDFTGFSRGLNEEGSKTLANFLRMNFLCQNQILFRYPGDALALFQFLDDYMFGEAQYGSGWAVHDFSSYVLLNNFNVLATDFFELAMGYDRRTGLFDPNGNGKADDWVPPYNDTTTWSQAAGWYNPPSSNMRPSLNGWGDNFVLNRIYWDPTNPNHPNNGKVIWSDSRDLLGSTNYVIGTRNFQQGAPPLINLIDFLTWITETLEYPTADDIFNWIEGKQPDSKYIIKRPDTAETVFTATPKSVYRCGIGLQGVWEMLERGSFNVTGLVNWLENKRKINVWGLFQELNNYLESYSDSPDPWSFIHYLINPNYAYAADGTSRYWMYHGSIGGTTGTYAQQTELARNNIWLLLNGSFWDSLNPSKQYWSNHQINPMDTLPGRIYMKLREMELKQIQDGNKGANLTFNLFQMFYNLGIKPEEWLKLIEQQGILPFELLAVIDTMNYEKMFAEARENQRKTRMKINGTFVFEFWNFKLSDTIYHSENFISYEIAPSDFTANDQLRYFWNVSGFSTTSGTLSFV